MEEQQRAEDASNSHALNKKQKHSGLIFLIILLVLVIVFGLGGFFYYKYLKKQPASTDAPVIKLSQEDLVSLTKPSTVRIIQHVKGTAKLPNFKADLTKFEIVPNPGKSQEIPIDEYISGTGFVFGKDGYILTNSHVVSDSSIKEALAGVYGYKVLLNDIYAQAEKIKKMDPVEQQAKGLELGKQMLKYIVENGDFKIDKQIFVLNPASSKDDFQELLKDSFPVKIISVNDKFFEDGKDAAIIKIEQNNLPEIKIGNSDLVSVGNKIAVFGFPSTADFSRKNLLESSFTGGVINAMKSSDNEDFKLFQTDAKISMGSSGSPILNDVGEAIGVATYQTPSLQQKQGDNFAFGIPMTAVKNFINSYGVEGSNVSINNLTSSDYSMHVVRGISLAASSKCSMAIKEFETAKTMNSAFIDGKYLDSKIDACKKVVADGKSIDSKWDEERIKYSGAGSFIYIVIAIGATVILLLGVFIFYLIKRIRKDENRIDDIDDRH